MEGQSSGFSRESINRGAVALGRYHSSLHAGQKGRGAWGKIYLLDNRQPNERSRKSQECNLWNLQKSRFHQRFHWVSLRIR
jgi:hypothetical protein